MQSIYSIEAYAYGRSKDVVSHKEEIKCKNIIKWYKKWLTDNVVKEITPNWP